MSTFEDRCVDLRRSVIDVSTCHWNIGPGKNGPSGPIFSKNMVPSENFGPTFHFCIMLSKL